MTVNVERVLNAYNQQKYFSDNLHLGLEGLSPDEKKEYDRVLKMADETKDPRYNEPKGKHKSSDEQINKTIESTQIYKEAKELILKAQQGQVGYGIDKYPEPLNAKSWTILESFDHIVDESVDKLHYEVMLRIQLEALLKYLDNVLTPNQIREAHGMLTMGAEDVSCNLGELAITKVLKPKSINEVRKDHGLPSLEQQNKDTDCQIKIKGQFYNAKFIEVLQYSDVLNESAMIGGHRGGTVAYPVAVVRHGAILKQVRLSDIIFEEELV